jgi:hypothetical protein
MSLTHRLFSIRSRQGHHREARRPCRIRHQAVYRAVRGHGVLARDAGSGEADRVVS